MKTATQFEKVFKTFLPAPFTIAVLLTLLTIIMGWSFSESSLTEVLAYWEEGIWNGPLLVFLVQMMLILVLGHILALSQPALKLINNLCALPKNPLQAAWLVCFSTMLLAFFNWGLALIYGAIIARSMGEKFSTEGRKLNYPLIGAAGYSGLMVWHGGISGSAPAKVAEEGHLKQMMAGVENFPISELPGRLTFESTVFGDMNIFTSLTLLAVLPLLMGILSQKTAGKIPVMQYSADTEAESEKVTGAEKLTYSKWFCMGFSLLILSWCIFRAFQTGDLSFLTLNFINLSLLGLGLLLHGNFGNFLNALEKAIAGAAGIIIQFPLYFGIIGIMKSTGLVEQISSFFISVCTPFSFPLFTFFSAGLVNIFVPSGGGQWSIQGPIIIQAAQNLGVDFSKSVMALAYGDQVTNMLQPFWALPLLAITRLKAREIIPYSLILLMGGTLIFIISLVLF